MKLPKAKTPFKFFSRLSLTVATGKSARDLRDLAEGVKTLPDSVVYSHTYRFVQLHQFLIEEPPNDFSLWASDALQDNELAEKLRAVDTMSYETIGELRGALASTLEEHLKVHPNPHPAPRGREFQFMRSVRFSFSVGFEARDLAEFALALKKLSFSSLYLHVFEARLRPPLGVNDFSLWLENELGEKILAKKASELDPYSQTLETVRNKMLKLVDSRIKELSRG